MHSKQWQSTFVLLLVMLSQLESAPLNAATNATITNANNNNKTTLAAISSRRVVRQLGYNYYSPAAPMYVQTTMPNMMGSMSGSQYGAYGFAGSNQQFQQQQQQPFQQQQQPFQQQQQQFQQQQQQFQQQQQQQQQQFYQQPGQYNINQYPLSAQYGPQATIYPQGGGGGGQYYWQTTPFRQQGQFVEGQNIHMERPVQYYGPTLESTTRTTTMMPFNALQSFQNLVPHDDPHGHRPFNVQDALMNQGYGEQTKIPVVTVTNVPETFSKSFNPYHGMTSRSVSSLILFKS
jgi:hypothetical protein